MRLDLFVSDKLGVSRTRAQNLIKSGGVSMGGVLLQKPSLDVQQGADISIQDTLKYASLGGLKLENALIGSGVGASDKRCLDLGAANGGFTDCLLQAGASEVVAVDVTISFPPELLSDPRVEAHDGVNVKEIGALFEKESFDLVTVDLSFISLCGLFSIISPLIKVGGHLMALFKPQFEVGRKYLPKSGIVRDKKNIEKSFDRFLEAARAAGLRRLWDAPVPDLFPDKNTERTVIFCKN